MMARSSGRPAGPVLLALLAALVPPGASAQKYLIVAAPSQSKIAYLSLSGSGAPAEGSQPMETLIGSGLTFPQGIAVDDYRSMLYVADPALNKLVGYKLKHKGGHLSVGAQEVIANDVEVRSVHVDGVGNIFMTDEPTERVLKITAEMRAGGQTTPIVLYEGASMPSLKAPGGIITDNFFLYWLNKADGSEVGSLVRAPQNAATGGADTQTLANVPEKCYGLCMALNSIFYTDTYNFYGVPRAATAVDMSVTVSTAMAEPRGCAFDGDGTVYVADKSTNAVYQFAAGVLQADASLTKAADLEGAYGVAIYAA